MVVIPKTTELITSGYQNHKKLKVRMPDFSSGSDCLDNYYVIYYVQGIHRPACKLMVQRAGIIHVSFIVVNCPTKARCHEVKGNLSGSTHPTINNQLKARKTILM